jgi:hypothetical protein
MQLYHCNICKVIIGTHFEMKLHVEHSGHRDYQTTDFDDSNTGRLIESGAEEPRSTEQS